MIFSTSFLYVCKPDKWEDCPQFLNTSPEHGEKKNNSKPPAMFLSVSLSLPLFFLHPSFVKPDLFFLSFSLFCFPTGPSPPFPPPVLSLAPLPVSFFFASLFLSVSPSLWPLSSHTRFEADSLFIAPVVLSL